MLFFLCLRLVSMYFMDVIRLLVHIKIHMQQDVDVVTVQRNLNLRPRQRQHRAALKQVHDAIMFSLSVQLYIYICVCAVGWGADLYIYNAACIQQQKYILRSASIKFVSSRRPGAIGRDFTKRRGTMNDILAKYSRLTTLFICNHLQKHVITSCIVFKGIVNIHATHYLHTALYHIIMFLHT